MITAILVDNGEALLERSLRSLKNQTVPVEIIVAPGPKTDLDVAKKLADRVQTPVSGIGKARVQAILEADTEYILSCDSDSVYDPHYAEFAVQDLKGWRAVKAGTILPLDWSGDPLSVGETLLSWLPSYEFAIAFRRQDFLDTKIHLEDYSDPLMDIGFWVQSRLGRWFDPRMVAYTRMPTRGAVKFSEKYLPQALAGVVPVAFVAGVAGLSEASRLFLS